MGDVDRHVLVAGALQLPRRDAAAWRERTIRHGDVRRWPEAFEGGHLDGRPVGEVLDAFSAMDEDQGVIRVKSTATRLIVRGFLLEEGMRAWSRDVAALLAAARHVGAEGDVRFIQVSHEHGAVLAVVAGRATLKALGADAIQEAGDDEDLQEAQELYAAASGARAETRPTPVRSPASSPSTRPHAILRELARTSLAAMSDADLHRLGLAQLSLQTGPRTWKPTAELFRTASDARRFYSELASDAAVESAFNVLAEHDPQAARPLARAVLRAGADGPLAMVACHLLSGSADPSDLDTLIEHAAPLPGPWPVVVQGDAAGAMAMCQVPEADARIHARIDALFDRPDAVSGIGRLAYALMKRGTIPVARARELRRRFGAPLWFLDGVRAPAKAPGKATTKRTSARAKPPARGRRG